MVHIDPVRLRDIIVEHFDIEELNGLLFELGVRKDEIAAQTIAARVEEVVNHCVRHGRLADLLAHCRSLRPSADWDTVLKETANIPAGIDPAREAAFQELRSFQALLAEGRKLFLRHNEQRGRLWQLIHANHAGDIPPSKGYDDLFYKMFDRLNEEELELFKIVRGNTKVGTHRVNQRIRDWAESHDVRLMFPQPTPAVDALERDLLELRVHLAEWFAKYEETFLTDPKRTLVYLGDEKRQGTRWPPGLESSVAAVIEGKYE